MEKAAFEQHYITIYKALYRFALYTLGNEADAEDAVAEAVADAWKGLKTLKDDQAFHAWIFKILSIKCRRRQAEYVRNVRLLDDDQERITRIKADDSDWEEAQDVRNAFGQLEAEERMIVSLSVFGGYSSREIGDMLELNSSTVRSKLSRGLGKMQTRLEG